MNKHKAFIKDCYEGKHKSMCQEWKDLILEHYPEFEPKEKFKVGDWVTVKTPRIYGWRDDTVRISRIDGFQYWSFNRLDCKKEEYTTAPYENYRKATKEEIETALIAEAKRRGFEKGVMVNQKPAYLGNGSPSVVINGGTFGFSAEYSNMHLGGTGIYNNGKWAEIIPTMTKEEAEKKLNVKIV